MVVRVYGVENDYLGRLEYVVQYDKAPLKWVKVAIRGLGGVFITWVRLEDIQISVD